MDAGEVSEGWSTGREGKGRWFLVFGRKKK